MTEPTLFQEIQEDLERQKLEGLWKKYGLWVIVAALGIVVATASSTAYRSWHAHHNQQLTGALVQATRTGSDIAGNIGVLQQFSDTHQGDDHAALALLRAGSLAADQNDKAKAIQIFDKVAADTKADVSFRQLGDLLSVQLQLDNGDAAALLARLEPLTAETGAWRYSAREAQGYLALRSGDREKAKKIFTDLSQDARAPQTIMGRAADVVRSLN